MASEPVLRHNIATGVTAQLTAEWIARHLTKACCWNEPPRYVIRDRDGAPEMPNVQLGDARWPSDGVILIIIASPRRLKDGG